MPLLLCPAAAAAAAEHTALRQQAGCHCCYLQVHAVAAWVASVLLLGSGWESAARCRCCAAGVCWQQLEMLLLLLLLCLLETAPLSIGPPAVAQAAGSNVSSRLIHQGTGGPASSCTAALKDAKPVLTGKKHAHPAPTCPQTLVGLTTCTDGYCEAMVKR